MELRVDGQVLITAVMREPLDYGGFQLFGITVDRTNTMADRLSSPGAKIEVEFVLN